ncbi:MAG: hypothetical protein D6791_11035 [Chloroflexi bacterium]|nr:MAG: hypothetical protein D6791_11035 [Chloroflexota bacterium]
MRDSCAERSSLTRLPGPVSEMDEEIEKVQPWRPAHELGAALAWLGAALWIAIMSMDGLLNGVQLALFALVLYLAIYRGIDAVTMLAIKRSLLGRQVTCVSPEYVVRKSKKRKDHLWLGWGFTWKREHAQLIYELERYDLRKIVPWWMRMIWRRGPRKGMPHIHGVGLHESDIYIPYKDLAGHCFIPATTGALKTRLLSLIALQAIHRKPKQAVIVVDPKGDLELLNLIRWACKSAGREEDFCYLHPAFPRESVRLDLMKNWTTTTEGASRVAEMMGGDESSAPFKAFGWQVINNIIQGMLMIGERPQLRSLRRYIESGPDMLIYRVICNYVAKLGRDPEVEIKRYMGEAKRTRGRVATTPQQVIAAVLYYKRELQPTQPMAAIDGLLTMYEHDAAHFSKMIATLQPIMAMLTTDELAELLSPDYSNADDPRELLDNARIMRTGRVLYVGLHSMPDATVSAAIGSLFLADMVAVLGERYVRNETKPEVTLLLDEANEIVNPPLVSMLNKGRGAGLMCFFFTQSVQDFVAKYGAEAPAMQLLGNANNVIFGRVLDSKTIEYVTEKTGETIIRQSQDQYGVNPVSGERNITNYHASYGVRKMDQRDSLVRQELCQAIPDLEYFGVFSGRNIVKGRIPVVVEKK